MIDIKAGDTVIIKGKVQHVRPNHVYISTDDVGPNVQIRRDRISEVIPAPVIPRQGEVWQFKKGHDKCVIIWADARTTVYELESTRVLRNTPEFRELYTPIS